MRVERSRPLKPSGPLAIDRMLARHRDWDDDAIRERGELLFDAALKVWPKP